MKHDCLWSGPPSVAEATLDNGLRIVAIPRSRGRAVTHMIWYGVGAMDDPVDKSGLSHFLEHLMFKGTERFPEDSFSNFIHEVGGRENAMTHRLWTNYYQVVPSEHLRACMEYEADRMAGPLLHEPVVAAERDVVLAERGQTSDNNPTELLIEAMQTAMFPAHQCGRPIIGWRHEIEGLSGVDALRHAARFYRPDNAIVVVAGAVEAETVFGLAREVYSTLPRGVGPVERIRLVTPPRRVHHRLTLPSAQVRQPMLRRIYAGFPPGFPDLESAAAALTVAADMLGRGQLGLLHGRLVDDDGCAQSVNLTYLRDTFPERSVSILTAVPSIETSLDVLDAALDTALVEIRKNGIPAETLASSKHQIVAEMTYEEDSAMTLAQRFGEALINGRSLADVAAWGGRIFAVTADDVVRALTHFEPGAAVTGFLVGKEA